MEILSNLLSDAVGTHGLTLGIVAIVAYLLLHVLTQNFRRFRRQPFEPDLLPGEWLVDRLRLDTLLSSSRLVLTNRRVLMQRVHWLLSRRPASVVDLADIHSVTWRVSINFMLLIVGLLAMKWASPVALLLVLAGLEGSVCRVAFPVAFSRMPFSAPGLLAFGRAQLPAFMRFHRNAAAAWGRLRPAASAGGMGDQPLTSVEMPSAWSDALGLSWGRPLWWTVILVMGFGIVQRLMHGHLVFEDALFSPIFIAVPVSLATLSLRDGLWAAFLSTAALFTIKFPGMPLFGDGSVMTREWLAVLVGMLAVAGIAHALARWAHPAAAVIAPLAWIIVPAITVGADGLDVALAARVLGSIACAAALIAIAHLAFGDERHATS